MAEDEKTASSEAHSVRFDEGTRQAGLQTLKVQIPNNFKQNGADIANRVYLVYSENASISGYKNYKHWFVVVVVKYETDNHEIQENINFI